MMKVSVKFMLVLVLGIFSQSLSAHVLGGNADFFGGLFHPWLGVDHWFIALTIAAWSVWHKKHSARWLPLIFIGCVAGGMLLPQVISAAVSLQTMTVVAIVLSLLLFISKVGGSLRWLASFAVVTGLVQGFIHTQELGGQLGSLAVGVTISTALIVLAGMGITTQLQRHFGENIWRTLLLLMGLHSLLLSVV